MDWAVVRLARGLKLAMDVGCPVGSWTVAAGVPGKTKGRIYMTASCKGGKAERLDIVIRMKGGVDDWAEICRCERAGKRCVAIDAGPKGRWGQRRQA